MVPDIHVYYGTVKYKEKVKTSLYYVSFSVCYTTL